MSDERDSLARPAARVRLRVLLAALLVTLFAMAIAAGGIATVRAADPSPVVDPSPSASPAPTPTPTPAPIITVRNTYRAGAAVRQYTIYWCVPASTQTMLNAILRTTSINTTRSYQTQLAKAIGVNNRYRYNVPGNDIRGWAKTLNLRIPRSSGVLYRDRAFRTQSAAMWAIVSAIDATGYPVGITVWHGRHAWTVTGYRTTQRPDAPSSRAITGFYVVGPLRTARYADPFPAATASRGVYVPLAAFKSNFSWYDEDRQRPPWHRAYVMVRPEPVLAAPAY